MITTLVSAFQMKKEKLFQMRISEDLLMLGNKLAAKRGISLAGLLRMLLLAELEKDKPSP